MSKFVYLALAGVATSIIACSSVSAEPLAPAIAPSLNLPSCQDTCYTLSVQTLPGGNGIQPSTELKFGISIDLNRTNTDRLKAIAKRLPAERKLVKQTFITGLERELTAAIAQQRYERARIIAIQLAPQLGYRDYRLYLSKISGGSFPNP